MPNGIIAPNIKVMAPIYINKVINGVKRRVATADITEMLPNVSIDKRRVQPIAKYEEEIEALHQP